MEHTAAEQAAAVAANKHEMRGEILSSFIKDIKVLFFLFLDLMPSLVYSSHLIE